MITGYRFFRIYHSLHLHFTTNYDIFKYVMADSGRRVKNISEETYNKRNDCDKFEGYARELYNDRTSFHFCIANFVHNNEDWLYDSMSEAQDIYNSWKGYFLAFEHRFKNDYATMKDIMTERDMTFEQMLVKTPKGNPPPLLQLMTHRKVRPEFVVSLHNHSPFLGKWYDQYKDVDPFLGKVTFTLVKYAPLAKIVTKDLRGQSEPQQRTTSH